MPLGAPGQPPPAATTASEPHAHDGARLGYWAVEGREPSDRSSSAGPAAGGDTRLLALRHAAQEASDFTMGDAGVRRFMTLRDRGASPDEMAADLGVEPDLVAALVRARGGQGAAPPNPHGQGTRS